MESVSENPFQCWADGHERVTEPVRKLVGVGGQVDVVAVEDAELFECGVAGRVEPVDLAGMRRESPDVHRGPQSGCVENTQIRRAPLPRPGSLRPLHPAEIRRTGNGLYKRHPDRCDDA